MMIWSFSSKEILNDQKCVKNLRKFIKKSSKRENDLAFQTLN